MSDFTDIEMDLAKAMYVNTKSEQSIETWEVTERRHLWYVLARNVLNDLPHPVDFFTPPSVETDRQHVTTTKQVGLDPIYPWGKQKTPKFKPQMGERFGDTFARLIDHYNEHVVGCATPPSVETDRFDNVENFGASSGELPPPSVETDRQIVYVFGIEMKEKLYHAINKAIDADETGFMSFWAQVRQYMKHHD